MKAIGLVAALMVLCVGSWAHFYYYEIIEELKNNHGLPVDTETYGPFDSVWGHFDFAWESSSSDSDFRTYNPRPTVSTGVHSNPHLASGE